MVIDAQQHIWKLDEIDGCIKVTFCMISESILCLCTDVDVPTTQSMLEILQVSGKVSGRECGVNQTHETTIA